MPIFEYRCLSCQQQFELLVKSSKTKPVCPVCGKRRVQKKIALFAVTQTEAQRLKSFDPAKAKDPSFFKDPRNIGLSTLHRARKMGVDLGEGFQEKLDRARSIKSIEDLKL